MVDVWPVCFQLTVYMFACSLWEWQIIQFLGCVWWQCDDLVKCSKALYLLVLKKQDMLVKHKCTLVNSSAPGGTYICPNDLVWKTHGCGHTEELPHHFSTENGSQCKQMTDRLSGNLIGSSVWRLVLLEAWGFCGEGQTKFREKEKGKPVWKMHFDCHILICAIVFWTRSSVISSKFQLKSQLEIVFVSCTCVLYHLNIFICGLMEIVRWCNKPRIGLVITQNRCFFLLFSTVFRSHNSQKVF